MRIRSLLLEDDEGILDALVGILEDRGYEVIAFREPKTCPVYREDGCSCPRDHACADILITDNRMPRMTGLEFIEHQLRNGCKLSVENKAVLSASLTDDERIRAEGLGCRVFVKPALYEDLEAWLENVERRHDPNRKLTPLEVLLREFTPEE